MFSIRICFILILTHITCLYSGIFAAPITTESGNTIDNRINTNEIKEEKSNTLIDEEIDSEKNIKIMAIEKNLQKLILEFAKIQGNNSLKNITQSFKKINPDTKSLLATYSSLQGQFNRIKKNIIDEGLTNSIRGDIIIPYCEYMIVAIEKKKKNLE